MVQHGQTSQISQAFYVHLCMEINYTIVCSQGRIHKKVAQCNGINNACGSSSTRCRRVCQGNFKQCTEL